MKLSDFRTAKAGDRVWSRNKGKWGVVETIERGANYPVEVSYHGESLMHAYDLYGRVNAANNISDIYWDEVEFPETPPPPKQKVKKTYWMAVNLSSARTNSGGLYNSYLFPTENEAETKLSDCPKRIVIPVVIEVEE